MNITDTVLAALIGFVGTLVGGAIAWVLARSAAVRDERKQRLREDLSDLRLALERFIRVLDQDRWWEPSTYETAWFDVVLAIGRVEKHKSALKDKNLDILRSVPGRELSRDGPAQLKRVAREAISMVDRLMP